MNPALLNPRLNDLAMYNPVARAAATVRAHYAERNAFNVAQYADCQLWDYIQRCGGVRRCCRVTGVIYDLPPWDVMPSEGREFQRINSIDKPAADTADNIVLQIEVPFNWDGVLTKAMNVFTGTGFTEGDASDLIWRVKINNRFARDLGNITTTYGSLASPFVIPGVGIRVVSGQVITYFVDVPFGSGATGGQVICGLWGWFFPRK